MTHHTPRRFARSGARLLDRMGASEDSALELETRGLCSRVRSVDPPNERTQECLVSKEMLACYTIRLPSTYCRRRVLPIWPTTGATARPASSPSGSTGMERSS